MHLLSREENSVVFLADALELIEQIPSDKIQCCITSPTYWGKRQFTSNVREFGKESLAEYVDRNVTLYEKILRKMKKEGSLFIVIQDSYMGSGVSRSHHNHWSKNKNPEYVRDGLHSMGQGNVSSVTASHETIKNKSLCGIPYRIAIALVDKGYIWREQIIWEKPNPMPENVKDRVRQSSEYILHFVKNRKYKFNEEYLMIKGNSGRLRMRNQVWVASTEPKEGHTATFPSKIVEKLLLASSSEGDLVFEPFLGSGTMYELSMKNRRNFVGCDISYKLIKDFIQRNRNLKRLNSFFPSKNQIDPIEDLLNLDNFRLQTPDQLEEIKSKAEAVVKDFSSFSHEVTKRILDDLLRLFFGSKMLSEKQLKKSFKGAKKVYQFLGYFRYNNSRVVIEIPSIHNFDTNKGAGPYYASIRLKEALELDLIDFGILLVPKPCLNGKFKEIIDDLKVVLIINVSQLDIESYLSGNNSKTDPIIRSISQWLKYKVKKIEKYPIQTL